MIDFLIKSGACLSVFLGFYHLLLQREKMHRFNRFYLLLSIVVSLILPFITFEIIRIVPAQAIIPMPEMPVSFEVIPEKIDYTPIVLWSLYGLVTLVLLLRFGKNIQKLISKATSNPTVNYKNARLVLVDDKTLPHTFLNSIFINFEDYNNRNIEDELYTHELVHVTQKHTLDILFVELCKTIFWFNPIFILYKKAIQLNHEFLADEKVVESYNDVPFYQSLLLQKSNGNQTIYLASNLNYLVTKKRLIMMTKSTSKSVAFVKKIAVAPVLAGLIFFICFEIVAQEKATLSKPAITLTDKDKIRDSYYAGVRVMLTDTRTNTKINKMYEDLSLEQKRNYLNWVPDMIIEKEVPAALFDKMKTKNLAVWIDSKVSSKEEISKYNRTDFSYYSYSFVHKNARSKRFPQEYQYTLYTKKYFDKNLKNSHLHFSNDTLKIVISDWKKADKVSKILNTPKADTVVWYNNDEKNKEYNISINDHVKKESASMAEAEETDKQPAFPGGNLKFYEFFAKNYNIPEEARKNKIKGNLYVAFNVEEDGSLSDIKIVKDLQYGTGNEVLRVLKICPKWIAGEINGKKARMAITLPINIQTD